MAAATAAAVSESKETAAVGSVPPRVIHLTLPSDPATHGTGTYGAVIKRLMVFLENARLSLQEQGIPLYVRLAFAGEGPIWLLGRSKTSTNKLRPGETFPPMSHGERLALLMDNIQWAGLIQHQLDVTAEKAAVQDWSPPDFLPTNVRVDLGQLALQCRQLSSGISTFIQRLGDMVRFIREPDQIASQDAAFAARHTLTYAVEQGRLVERTAVSWRAGSDPVETWWRSPHSPDMFKGNRLQEGYEWILALPHAAAFLVTLSQKNLQHPLPFPPEREGRATSSQGFDALEEAAAWGAFDGLLRSFAPPWFLYELPLRDTEDVKTLTRALLKPAENPAGGMRAAGQDVREGYMRCVRSWTARDMEAASRAPSIISARRQHVYWHVLPQSTEGWTAEHVSAIQEDAALQEASYDTVVMIPLVQGGQDTETVAQVARALVCKDEDVLWAPPAGTSSESLQLANETAWQALYATIAPTL